MFKCHLIFYYKFQHLSRAGLYRTHEAFKSECEDLNIPIQNISSTEQKDSSTSRAPLVSENTVHQLLNAFDEADQDLFFKARMLLVQF